MSRLWFGVPGNQAFDPGDKYIYRETQIANQEAETYRQYRQTNQKTLGSKRRVIIEIMRRGLDPSDEPQHLTNRLGKKKDLPSYGIALELIISPFHGEGLGKIIGTVHLISFRIDR